MHVLIHDLAFDLNDLVKNPGLEAEVREELFATFAQAGGSQNWLAFAQNRIVRRCEAQFTGRQALTPEEVHSWLLNKGFVGFNVQFTYE